MHNIDYSPSQNTAKNIDRAKSIVFQYPKIHTTIHSGCPESNVRATKGANSNNPVSTVHTYGAIMLGSHKKLFQKNLVSMAFTFALVS